MPASPIRMALALAAAALFLAPSSVLASEERAIGGGRLDAIVAWAQEPPYVGQQNAITIRLAVAGTNPAQPVTGAEKTLSVEVQQGAASRKLPLHAVFGQPGYYAADLIPTAVGNYQFTFTGTAAGTPVQDTFRSSDGKVAAVQTVAALQFPVALGDPAQLARQTDAARSEAQSARTMALVAAGVAALAVLLALLALGRGRSGSRLSSGRSLSASRRY